MCKLRRLDPRLLAYVFLFGLAFSYKIFVSADNTVIGNYESEKHSFKIVVLTDELSHPWSIAFLPNGEFLITEKQGRLRRFADGALDPIPIEGLPEIANKGQGGLLDVAVHPDFVNNQLIYFTYSASNWSGASTQLARARLVDHTLKDLEELFIAKPKSRGGRHFGSRIVFAPDGYLYLTLGDRGQRELAQELSSHTGSMIRLNHDGTVPADNPFVSQESAMPEIFSYGHRNIQGLAVQPGTGLLWSHEHGPQGGDELNIVRAGVNYGWPTITYGRNYGSGTKIGEGTEKAGMQQPVYYWVPSIAPSGMAFYKGNAFPKWNGNIFIGSLKFRHLTRLELHNETVVHEEILLANELGRIRDVRTGPDGFLYLLTDDDNGKLVRLEPL